LKNANYRGIIRYFFELQANLFSHIKWIYLQLYCCILYTNSCSKGW